VKYFAIFWVMLSFSISLLAETRDPYPEPNAQEVIVVGVEEFAALPNYADKPAQMKNVISEPGTDNLIVNDMSGMLYRVDSTGSATTYLEVADPKWGTGFGESWREVGLHSVALNPDFSQEGEPGYGKLYTWMDASIGDSVADYPSAAAEPSHHSVLFEWTANDVHSAQYDGGMPREVLRIEQPFPNHNASAMAFNPLVSTGDYDYGLLYLAVGDGGGAGDQYNASQNLSLPHGKILLIDPLGDNSANGNYGIPANNPFIGETNTLPEIYAYGLRNLQQFAWDSETGALIVTDLGQAAVEEINLVTAGDNLGWNHWEGSFAFPGNPEGKSWRNILDGVDDTQVRSDPSIRYPIAEYDHRDPLGHTGASGTAVTGLAVVRDSGITELEGYILFGDLVSGEVFAVPADKQHLYNGQSENRRVLFDDGSGEAKTLLQIVQEARVEQGLEPPPRMDLRFASGADNQVYLLNKYDGIIRRIVAP